jgi:hypothetical protein
MDETSEQLEELRALRTRARATPRRLWIERSGQRVAGFMYKRDALLVFYTGYLIDRWLETEDAEVSGDSGKTQAEVVTTSSAFLSAAIPKVKVFMECFDEQIQVAIDRVFNSTLNSADFQARQKVAEERGCVIPELTADQMKGFLSPQVRELEKFLKVKGRGRRKKLEDGDIRRALVALGASASEPQVAKWLKERRADDVTRTDVVNWRHRNQTKSKDEGKPGLFDTWKQAKNTLLNSVI